MGQKRPYPSSYTIARVCCAGFAFIASIIALPLLFVIYVANSDIPSTLPAAHHLLFIDSAYWQEHKMIGLLFVILLLLVTGVCMACFMALRTPQKEIDTTPCCTIWRCCCRQ